jgi:hypothetical protein
MEYELTSSTFTEPDTTRGVQRYLMQPHEYMPTGISFEMLKVSIMCVTVVTLFTGRVVVISLCMHFPESMLIVPHIGKTLETPTFPMIDTDEMIK